LAVSRQSVEAAREISPSGSIEAIGEIKLLDERRR
jgi:hypothetical protein